jgi:CheY-like chemotaxis protein
VLVLDDEPSIGATLRELLAHDHEVRAVTTAREALELLRTDDGFDVIFCDLVMPEMSGIELYHVLRIDRPGLERRIVFMTGGAFTSRTAEFLASVDNRRVEKPFSLGLIEKIVRDMVRSRAKSARPRVG